MSVLRRSDWRRFESLWAFGRDGSAAAGGGGVAVDAVGACVSRGAPRINLSYPWRRCWLLSTAHASLISAAIATACTDELRSGWYWLMRERYAVRMTSRSAPCSTP